MEKLSPDLQKIVDFLCEGVSESELPKADAIFVFGNHRPFPAEQAARLYKLGAAPKIVISGNRPLNPNPLFTIPKEFSCEADYYASIIENAGVPRSALILERQATNTLENIQFGMRECRRLGFEPRKLILIAIPQLLRRSIATFKRQFPEVECVGNRFELPTSAFTEATVKRMLGEFERYIEYAAKGDMMPVVVPSDVAAAVSRVKQNQTA
ncbi:MAG: YdcF family protein [bacterium]